LSENHAAPSKAKRLSITYDKEDAKEAPNIYDILKGKREEVEKFEVRAKRLVEIMRVSDLTKIPVR
jgi:hypothetical protein